MRSMRRGVGWQRPTLGPLHGAPRVLQLSEEMAHGSGQTHPALERVSSGDSRRASSSRQSCPKREKRARRCGKISSRCKRRSMRSIARSRMNGTWRASPSRPSRGSHYWDGTPKGRNTMNLTHLAGSGGDGEVDVSSGVLAVRVGLALHANTPAASFARRPRRRVFQRR